jgi:hypothetical protein
VRGRAVGHVLRVLVRRRRRRDAARRLGAVAAQRRRLVEQQHARAPRGRFEARTEASQPAPDHHHQRPRRHGVGGGIGGSGGGKREAAQDRDQDHDSAHLFVVAKKTTLAGLCS